MWLKRVGQVSLSRSLMWPLAQKLLVKEQLRVHSFNTLLRESILKRTRPAP